MKKKNETMDRLYLSGPSSLTDVELLSLILGDQDAAYVIMQKGKGSLKNISSMYLSELSAMPLLTPRKAAIVVAFCELNRRRNNEVLEGRKVMASSTEVADFLKARLEDHQHEVFGVLFLNRANKIVGFEIVSSGGITGTVADPRLILKKALDYRAVSLVLSHNHPSGSLRPSRMDEELTTKIKEAAKYFDIKILDHVIVSHEGYYSFADEGLL